MAFRRRFCRIPENCGEDSYDDAGAGGTDTTRFAYDGWKPGGSFIGNENFDIWADLDGDNSNALETRYLRGDIIDQLFARIHSGGNPYWTLTDRLDSVRDVINNSGTIKDTIAYDGFGNISSETDSSFRGRYAWTSRELDVETGLQYNRARYYDPATGRWISQDPLGFHAGDGNLYRYVENQPTVATDPSGLFLGFRNFQEFDNWLGKVSGGEAAVNWIASQIVRRKQAQQQYERQLAKDTEKLAKAFNKLMEEKVLPEARAAMEEMRGNPPPPPRELADHEEFLLKLSKSLGMWVHNHPATQWVLNNPGTATLTVLDIATSFLDARDLAELVTGYDAIWNRPLTTVEYSLTVVGAAAPLVPASSLRGAWRWFARVLGFTDEAADAVDARRLLPAPPSVVYNRRGVPYPTVIDPRTGQAIPFPSTIVRTPAASRVPWNDTLRDAFRKEWERRGFPEPPGGWGNYDIHHVQPRKWGGTNAFENLVPVERNIHQKIVTPWWSTFSGR